MKNKIAWGSLIVVVYVVFCYLIPVHIYSISPRLIAIFGGIITTVFLFFFISSFSGQDQKGPAALSVPSAEDAEIKVPDEKRQLIDTFFFKLILALVSISFFTFLYNIKEHEIERRETDQYGELATAKITALQTLPWRRPNVSDLTVGFKTKDSIPVAATQRMSDQKAAAYHPNQEVFVLYSSRYPTVFRILTTGEELKTDRIKNGSK